MCGSFAAAAGAPCDPVSVIDSRGLFSKNCNELSATEPPWRGCWITFNAASLMIPIVNMLPVI
jgi:hypothetical protein